jgi:hypothetical protein
MKYCVGIKRMNLIIYKKMDEIGGHYVKWNKSDAER